MDAYYLVTVYASGNKIRRRFLATGVYDAIDKAYRALNHIQANRKHYYAKLIS
jgi:hypothetical protein